MKALSIDSFDWSVSAMSASSKPTLLEDGCLFSLADSVPRGSDNSTSTSGEIDVSPHSSCPVPGIGEQLRDRSCRKGPIWNTKEACNSCQNDRQTVHFGFSRTTFTDIQILGRSIRRPFYSHCARRRKWSQIMLSSKILLWRSGWCREHQVLLLAAIRSCPSDCCVWSEPAVIYPVIFCLELANQPPRCLVDPV